MVWVTDIDPTKPSDADPASQGDDQIRTLKLAIEERLITKMPGWPDLDPIRILGAEVGLEAAKPATPLGDGEFWVSHDTKKIYYGYGGAWFEWTVPAAALPPPPPEPEYSDVPTPTTVVLTDQSTCTGTTPAFAFNMSWVNGAVSATLQTRIYAGGALIHTGLPGETSAVGLTVAGVAIAQTVVITIRHYDTATSTLGPALTRTWTVPSPCAPASTVQPLTSFAVTDVSVCPVSASYEVQMAFVRQDVAASVWIYYDGNLILVAAPNIPSPLTHALPPGDGVGTHTYEALQEVAGAKGPAITRQIAITDPCAPPVLAKPINLSAQEYGECIQQTAFSQNKVRLTWTNKASFPTKVYARNVTLSESYAEIVQVGIGTANYVWDNSGAYFTRDDIYEFYVTHYNSVGPVESAPSNTASYYAVDICAEGA